MGSGYSLHHCSVSATSLSAPHPLPDMLPQPCPPPAYLHQLARVVQRPTEEQLEVAKRLVRYLGSTASAGVQFLASGQLKQFGADGITPGTLKLSCFTDATWASEEEDHSSVSGFIYMVGAVQGCRPPAEVRHKFPVVVQKAQQRPKHALDLRHRHPVQHLHLGLLNPNLDPFHFELQIFHRPLPKITLPRPCLHLIRTLMWPLLLLLLSWVDPPPLQWVSESVLCSLCFL
ncbi:unnamed protein product [Closterium sp. NIES-54]